MDISPAVSLLLDYNAPRFAVKGFSEIRMWIAEGCDLEQDIVPTMKRLMAVNRNIGGLSYFRKAVCEARDTRKDIEAARSARGSPNHASLDAARARHLAFLIRKLGKCMPTDERWLASYEQQHGEVLV